jgi:hypothetical protein
VGWTFGLLFIILVAGLAVSYLFTRGTPTRRELKQQIENREERPPIDIHQLVREEAADLGIDRVPGGDGVDLPVLLRVWKRDVAIRNACADGVLIYQLRPGVAADAATDDDVRVVCRPEEGETPPWTDPVTEPATTTSGSNDAAARTGVDEATDVQESPAPSDSTDLAPDEPGG